MIKALKSLSDLLKHKDEYGRLIRKSAEGYDHCSKKLDENESLLRELNKVVSSMANIGHGKMESADGISYFDPDGYVSRVVVNPDPTAGDLAKQVLRLMSPMDVVDGSYIRVGNEYDGGYVMIDQGLHDTVAYSFGINDDVSWDQGMVDRGCDIYQFDHTIEGLPYENERFHWHKLGIAGETGGEFISVRDIMANNGHQDRNDLILKMDIEGAEWSVFESLSSEDIGRFSQIVVELHSFVTGGASHLQRVAAALEKVSQTHQSVHYHANNWSWLGIIGGVTIADVFELTFVRKSDHQFVPSTREFPTPLDRPCRVGSPDYFLKL